MKPLFYLFAICLLFSCKKKEEPNPVFATYTAPDFELIPTKDAKWHVKGIGLDNPDQFMWYGPRGQAIDFRGMVEDSAYSKFDVYITAIGKDTVISNRVFHVYQVDEGLTWLISDTVNMWMHGRAYLRGDTSTMKVYYPNGVVALDFSDDANKGITTPFLGWAPVDIAQPDNLLIGGCYLKHWVMRNQGDPKLEYFYKAIGIGTPAGIFPSNYFGQITSMEFTYKGDSIHFEYPLQ